MPAQEVESETARVTADVQKRAKLQGFRPGKAPASLIRKYFAGDIRQQVLEALVPKHLHKQFEAENLNVVGSPTSPTSTCTTASRCASRPNSRSFRKSSLRITKTSKSPTTIRKSPTKTSTSASKRLREQKAEYVNVDPRPVEDGDHAVVSLESLSGVEGDPVKTDEMTLEIGGADTLPAFTENLRGVTPGDEREFEVAYPEDYGSGTPRRQDRQIPRRR